MLFITIFSTISPLLKIQGSAPSLFASIQPKFSSMAASGSTAASTSTVGIARRDFNFSNRRHWSGKFQAVEIVGLSGVGKTTVAQDLLNCKSLQYSGSCFVSDVIGKGPRSRKDNLGKRFLPCLEKLGKLGIEGVQRSGIGAKYWQLVSLVELWAYGCLKLKSIQGMVQLTKFLLERSMSSEKLDVLVYHKLQWDGTAVEHSCCND